MNPLFIFPLWAVLSLSNPPVFRPDTLHVKPVSRILYGFHYEEIGMMGEGGLHAELIRNRGFEEANPPQGHEEKDGVYLHVPGAKPVYRIDPLVGWETVPGSPLRLQLTDRAPLTRENPHALQVRLPATSVASLPDADLYNVGFLGMGFRQGCTYRLGLWIRNTDFHGHLHLSLVHSTGTDLSAPVSLLLEPGAGEPASPTAIQPATEDWRYHRFTLQATQDARQGRLRLHFQGTGSLLLDQVSLYPLEASGATPALFRADILSHLQDYGPAFLRFPGGCIVHGTNVQTQYHWKSTLGPAEHRPGAWSKWEPHYRSDGLGYHEFLELSERLGAHAMYVCPTGMVCTGWVFRDLSNPDTLAHRHPQVDVQDYVQDVLDAIEYALGDTTTHWGRQRAANGHPAPFPLQYVEIGNEDFGELYYQRYEVIASAIRSRWPQLRLIANSPIGKPRDNKQKYLPAFKDLGKVDLYDEHYYNNTDWARAQWNRFEAYDRQGPDLFIGELGIGAGYPLGNLCEGVFKLALEKNGDLRPLLAERPLMRNWDFVGRKGPLPLLLHDELLSVRTFNYYMSKLIKDNPIDRVYGQYPPVPETGNVFATCGLDMEQGVYVVKIINLDSRPTDFDLDLRALHPGPFALQTTTLQSSPRTYNSPEAPSLCQPTTQAADHAPALQHLHLPAYSLTLLRARPQ